MQTGRSGRGSRRRYRRAARPAKHQCRGQRLGTPLVALLFRDRAQEPERRPFSERGHIHMNRGERRVEKARHRDVVESGHRHIVRHPNAGPSERAQGSDRHGVVGGKDRSGPGRDAKQSFGGHESRVLGEVSRRLELVGLRDPAVGECRAVSPQTLGGIEVPRDSQMMAIRVWPRSRRCRIIAYEPSKLAMVITSKASGSTGACSSTSGNPAGRLRTAASASMSGHIRMRPSTRPRMDRSAASTSGRASCELETSR